MPIKPENRHHYRTPEWKAARLAVLKRAGEVRGVFDSLINEASCEFCWARNHETYERVSINGVVWQRLPWESRWSDCECRSALATLALGDLVVRSVKIVLTVAHLDHDPTNNSLENLRALCQRCHNRHDVPHRSANRAKTRAAKIAAKAAGHLLDGVEHHDMPNDTPKGAIE